MDLQRDSRFANSWRPTGGMEVGALDDKMGNPKPFIRRKPGENEKAERQPSIATDASNPSHVNREEPGLGSLGSPFAGRVAESGSRL
jgi:hypothetical protein